MAGRVGHGDPAGRLRRAIQADRLGLDRADHRARPRAHELASGVQDRDLGDLSRHALVEGRPDVERRQITAAGVGRHHEAAGLVRGQTDRERADRDRVLPGSEGIAVEHGLGLVVDHRHHAA